MDGQMPQTPQNSPPNTPPPAPAPQYGQYPQPQPYYGPKKSAFEGMVKNNVLSGLVVLGMVFLLLGAIFIHASPLVTNYGSNPPDTDRRLDDQAFATALQSYGNILVDLGVFFLVTFLLLAGILRTDLEKFARLGLILGAALMIAYWVI